MNTRNENAVMPDDEYRAMEPFVPPAGNAACAVWRRDLFERYADQQAVFDNESANEERDLPRAREMCRRCDIRDDCGRYAGDSRETDTFLGGRTVEERLGSFRKAGEIAKRRRQVAELQRLGYSVPEIADRLGRHQSLIRGDLRKGHEVRDVACGAA